MIWGFIILAFGFLFPIFGLAASSDIAISEILFDPVGTDTGLEYIMVKNFGLADVNLAGWDLYPAGAGYFTFPSFSLPAGGDVKVHLRASGSQGAGDFYHVSASGNMSNSSGSVALFSSSLHSKDTIVSYVRYYKPGSSENKTWESAASDDGIWSAGDFVDLVDFAEGQILGLQNPNQKTSSQGWVVKNIESAVNLGGESDQIADVHSGNFEVANSVSKIKAGAGEDRTILAGAEVSFFGSADGFTENSVNKARFMWNFGDGHIGEGKAAAHAFAHPGVYTVFLTVSFAGVSSSDSIQVAVLDNPVVLSEAKPGAWIEIHNNSARKIDFSNFGIAVSGARPFYFPANTFLAPWAYLALDSATIGFEIPSTGEIKLLYPNGRKIFGSIYPNLYLNEKESASFANGSWARSKATPGAKNEVIKISAAPSSANFQPVVKQSGGAAAGKNEEIQEQSVPLASALNTDRPPRMVGEYLWLIAGLGAGIFAGLVFIFAKRYLA